MSFFNDLKNTDTSLAYPCPRISPEARKVLVENICSKFMNECLQSKRQGIRYAIKYYTWIDERLYGCKVARWESSTGNSDKYVAIDEQESTNVYQFRLDTYSDVVLPESSYPLMSYNECQKTLVLVNSRLAKEGFPDNTATIHKIEVVKKKGLFFDEPGGSLYCLKLEAYWN